MLASWALIGVVPIIMVASVNSDPSGELWPYVLVVYKFDGVPEHTVLVPPHRNAKENKPYRRTNEKYKEATSK